MTDTPKLSVPRLMLLPGLACDTQMWQQQAHHLPALFRPTVTDTHCRFPSIETMAGAILAETNGDLILFGASMGGIIAMEAARQAPGRVRGLALLGTNARPETADMRQLREAAIGMFEQGRAREVLQLNLSLAFHPGRAKDTALTRAYLDMILSAGSAQLIAQNRAIMARPDALAHLPQLTCPSLVMCGDADRLTPPDCSREIAAALPGAELAIVAQCGHMLTMERPNEVNQILNAWLSRHFGQ